MKFNFPSIEKYVCDDDDVVASVEGCKEYVNIPQLMSEHGGGLLGSLKMRAPTLPTMVACMRESKKSAAGILENPKTGKLHIDDGTFAQLEAYIKGLGISDIGYAKVPASLVFRGHKILYGNGIVLTFEMAKEKMSTAPSKVALREVFRTYYELGVAVNKIAEFLRKNGFNAMAGPAVGGDANYPPIAELAGLGKMGRHGLLISDRDFGPSLRLAVVYTDIENLPFATENSHEWVAEFCKTCGVCVKKCPVKAIYEQRLADGRSIDQTACAKPFAREFGCSVCIKNCVFFNGEYEKIKESFLAKID